ncbi:fumarylacetoacetase [Phaeobacter sp. J2-8]|uniref:fumarylacetoacetase n=1 Tax=Phaeobacter sp. J2-8 TaxID=2931394 RepID=UPI001FD00ACB|nr:fumarylacetoacetase [Phaeobacter sp. J2-8]MCJ7874704.1 fumarylacetoacetase [Phaeobacter sp. J2-8]
MTGLNPTHDPKRKSWVDTANSTDTDFPIQNLPFGVFSEGEGPRRVGVAIGDMILDLTALEVGGKLTPGGDTKVFDQGVLNPFMGLAQTVWSQTRAKIADLLDAEGGDPSLPLVARSAAQLHLPVFVRSYTDFYASKEHATNVGCMFRDPDNALMPNWLHIPIGYNGRASTVVVSGTPVHRPNGQLKGPQDDAPRFGACQKLDIELELGALVGTPNPMGQPVGAAEAYDNIFGYVLINDWSARDIQVWEYQPLGPFQSKAFGTTISPWIVTREALEPFRAPAPERVQPLLPYLHEETPNNFDIRMEVALAPKGQDATVISRTNYKYMYYSSALQLVHHASSGCAMETGDLLGSGTISGPTPDSFGSMLELTWNGRDPVEVDGGTRTFLEDGDTVAITGWCEGAYRIGFGNCDGTILPAVDFGIS